MQTNSNRESNRNRRTKPRRGWDAEAQAQRKQAKRTKRASRQQEPQAA